MPNTFWESKGKYDPKEFEAKSDPTVSKTESAALEAQRQAEEMKKMADMALAAMAQSTAQSEAAVEKGNNTLKEVQEVQAGIKK
jgi:hypothetical protein